MNISGKIMRLIKTINYPSYIIFFVTARCNARCKMCFYEEHIRAGKGAANELTLEEYERISKSIRFINVLGISGGEPFLRDDLADIVKILYRNCSPLVADIPTNGYFTENIIGQVKAIAEYCRDMTVDVQLSIDGPEDVHNEIRGLKDGFGRMKKTYAELVSLKKHYQNLKVKGCVVYSAYNQHCIDELLPVLDRDFNKLDRVVFSVVHGSVSNQEAFAFDWDRYFSFCNKLRDTARAKSAGDFHTIFTMALRAAKNEYLRKVLQTRDVYKKCGAGRRMIVINEEGKVFPCEPLWSEVGDLRKNNYDMEAVLHSPAMAEFSRRIKENRCNCHWNIPLTANLIYKPEYYPKIIAEMAKIIFRSITRERTQKEACH